MSIKIQSVTVDINKHDFTQVSFANTFVESRQNTIIEAIQ